MSLAEESLSSGVRNSLPSSERSPHLPGRITLILGEMGIPSSSISWSECSLLLSLSLLRFDPLSSGVLENCLGVK
jgi:hypothetical protein